MNDQLNNEVLDVLVSEMVAPTEIFTCQPNTPIFHILRKFKENNFGSVVVVEGGKPVGIFTERDYVKKVAGQEALFANSPVSEFMTENPVCVTLEDQLRLVLIEMQLGGFRHVVVVDSHQYPVNVISVKDVLDHLVLSFEHSQSMAA